MVGEAVVVADDEAADPVTERRREPSRPTLLEDAEALG
jgi:hypothetical protein